MSETNIQAASKRLKRAQEQFAGAARRLQDGLTRLQADSAAMSVAAEEMRKANDDFGAALQEIAEREKR